MPNGRQPLPFGIANLNPSKNRGFPLFLLFFFPFCRGFGAKSTRIQPQIKKFNTTKQYCGNIKKIFLFFRQNLHPFSIFLRLLLCKQKLKRSKNARMNKSTAPPLQSSILCAIIIIIAHSGTTANSIAARNPFKYRGYYYDSDLGLQSGISKRNGKRS